MRHLRIFCTVLAAAAAAPLLGCQQLGPNSIDVGRGNYNNIIQSTSMEQTMANIVRVYHREPPMFLDVTEVDATVTAGGSITGGTTNIGAKRGTTGSTIAGEVESINGTVQYSETPTIRYQPLLGQALVAQLVTPVSVDALGLLYDSSWAAAPLLDFSAAYLTPDTHEFYLALDTIVELRDHQAVEIVAGPSSHANPPDAAANSADAGPAKKDPHANNDALEFYLLGFHKDADSGERARVLQLWLRMFRLYDRSQPAFASSADCKALGLTLDEDVLSDWDVHLGNHIKGTEAQKLHMLDQARACLPGYVQLRVEPSTGMGGGQKPAGVEPPMLRTYSALGILKNVTQQPGPRIEFVTPQAYRDIRAAVWNADESQSFYTLLPTDLDSVDCAPANKQHGGCENPLPPDDEKSLDGVIVPWLQASIAPPAAGAPDTHPDGVTLYEEPGADVFDGRHLYLNGRLGTLRRYMLIIADDHPPSGPVYVSYSDGEKWYYIPKDDAISQRNFQLISLLMTIMAIPPSTQPLSPVISVGG